MRSEGSEQSTYENPQSLVENLAPDTSSQINTNFMEQRIVESQRAYPSTQEALSSRVEAEMSDSTWFARHQLMKPVQIAQSAWSVTDPRDTDLYTADFPDVLQNVESLVYRTLRMYSFYKLSPCFRVQINATQFHQGQLICSFDPFYQSTRGATEDFCHIYATGLPNVKVMASESDAVELCVPFIHPRSFLTTNNASIFNNMGRFRVTILNPLAVAEGTSPNVTVSIWVYAKDASVHVPIQDHVPILEGSAEIVATSGQFQNTMSGLFGAVSPIISKIKGGYNQASDVVGNLITGNIGQALRKGQGLVDTLGDLFGFDYPARTINPPKTISPVENLAVGKGVSQSQRLAIDPFSLHILRDDVASESVDAMNLLKIAQMPMLLTQFAFANQAADALLFSCPVSPVVCATYQNRLRRTYLSFVSNGFAYWSGGINFDIEVVATRFHSGKLLFAYVPNTEDVPTYSDAATSLPNVIVDIQQTSKTTFKIPYTSSTAMKNTLHLDSSAVLDSEFADCAIGTVVCYVQNTLAYASNVSPSIEINIYISGGDDFSLYVPALPIIDKPTSAIVALQDGEKLTAINEMSKKLFKQRQEIIPTAGIGLNVNKNNEDTTMAVLSLSQNDSIPRSHFGEDYSLIDLIRRFSILNITTLNWDAGATQSFASIPIGTYAVPTIYPSFLTYWSQIYSAWSGTIRYKFIFYGVRTSNISIQISHLLNLQYFYAIDDYPGIANISNVNGFGMVRTQLCQDVALELEAPYYSKYNMLLTQGSNAAQFDVDKYSFNGYLAIQGVKTDTTALNLPMDVYTSAGEDFRFLYVRSPPSDTSQNLFTVSTLA